MFLRSTRRKRLLYDAQDFVDCVNDNKGTVILMHPEDFFDFQNEGRSVKDVHCPLIADISEAWFRRNESFSGNPPSPTKITRGVNF